MPAETYPMVYDSEMKRLSTLRSLPFRRPVLITVALCCLALISVGAAHRVVGNGHADKPTIPPAFTAYQSVVRQYLVTEHAHGTNHICITEVGEGKAQDAWVLWSEGKRIILWEQGLDDLALSRRQLSTETDVVVDDTALHGSTYLVTASWLQDLRQTCASTGISFLVQI